MYDLRHFLAMSRDPVRFAAYRDAIRATIRAGDRVLDLGCGTGLLTFLALEAGASHVVAVDLNAATEVMKRVAKQNGLAERVTIVHGDARRLNIPPVDVLMGDVRTALPISRDNVNVWTEVKRRYLKPGGRTIPVEDTIHFAPASCPEAHLAVAGWRAPMGSTDYAAAADEAASIWFRHEVRAEALLAEGARLGLFSWADEPPPKQVGGSHTFVVQRAGELDGLVAWFDATLAPGVGFTTSPAATPTVYGQAFFPFGMPRAVQPGDQVVARLEARNVAEHAAWRWSVQVRRGETDLGGEQRWFLGLPLPTTDQLARRRADHVPQAEAALALKREVLNLVDGRRTLEQIAQLLTDGHPDRFARWEEALGMVSGVIESASGTETS
jgi:type I protein arginine methyltransferase